MKKREFEPAGPFYPLGAAALPSMRPPNLPSSRLDITPYKQKAVAVVAVVAPKSISSTEHNIQNARTPEPLETTCDYSEEDPRDQSDEDSNEGM